MFMLKGRILHLDQSFIVGEGITAITYPPNWLRQATPDERAAIGIAEAADGQRPDDRFYFVVDIGNGSFSQVARPLETIKAAMFAQVNEAAYVLLDQTRWYIERSMDPSSMAPIPDRIVAARGAIRERAEELEAQIHRCDSVEMLAAVSIIWP